MKFKKTLVTLALALVPLFSNSVQAQENREFVRSGSVDVSVASQYLAGKAGFSVVDHPVIQTYGEVSTKLGTFYEWSNSRIKEKDTSELDLGFVSPSLNGKYFGANLAFSGYTYPNSDKKFKQWDEEVGANVFSRNLPINANLYLAANFADKQSEIFKLTAGKSLKIGPNNLSFEGALVYSDKYYSDYSGFSHVTLRTELARPLTKNIEIYGGVTLQEPLNSFGGKVNDEQVKFVGARYKFR